MPALSARRVSAESENTIFTRKRDAAKSAAFRGNRPARVPGRHARATAAEDVNRTGAGRALRSAHAGGRPKGTPIMRGAAVVVQPRPGRTDFQTRRPFGGHYTQVEPL